MKTYNDMELEIGINWGDTSTDSTSWSKYTQDMRRDAIDDAEMQIFKASANPVVLFPLLQSEPINATGYISSNILKLPDNLSLVLEMYHRSSAGVNTPITERTKAWDKLQDGMNFSSTIDPYFYSLGGRKYQIKHGIASPNIFYIVALKFPQTYEESFDYGDNHTELEGFEKDIINGATGIMLMKVDQAEKAGGYLTLFQNCLKGLK